MDDFENKPPLDILSSSAKEYVNLKIDEYKLKGVEHLSVLSNKLIFILIATMLGGAILQLIGLAISYFIGQLVGNIALGFLIASVIFIIILLVIYLRRDKLFTNKLVSLFIKIFFEKKQ
ncbi:MAG: hypothetical protein RSC28_00110 [Bacteroidales bacterium]